MKSQPPETRICKYCGAEVEPEGLVLAGMVFMWKQNTRCKCKQSQEYWAKYDAAEKDRRRKEKEAEEAEERKRRIERLIGRSGLKKRFLQRTFENFTRDTPGREMSYNIAHTYAEKWPTVKKNGKGLWIEGTNGTGKTHIAAAIALYLMERGVPVICKTGSDILADVKRAYDNQNITEQQIIDVYRKVDLLIVDDLGKEQCSDWSMTTLFTIFNDRYEDMRPTIITTNYNEEGLKEMLTPKGYDSAKIDAILSRLRETSIILTMAWEDCRSSI